MDHASIGLSYGNRTTTTRTRRSERIPGVRGRSGVADRVPARPRLGRADLPAARPPGRARAAVSATSSPVISFPRSETWSRRWRSIRTRCLKAYQELETKGLTVGRPGQGTFILATLNQVALPELTELRRSLTPGWPRPTRRGSTRTGSLALVANVLRDFRERRGDGTRARRDRSETEGRA